MGQPSEVVKHRSDRRVLATQEEYLAAVVEITGQASRGLAILTPDLEPEIYEQELFLDMLKRFVLAKSFARIRVLVTAPERAMKSGNQFVQMGRRLNSYIEFRNISDARRPRDDAFCIADDVALAYRPRSDSWEGMADTNAPAVAKKYLDIFDELWQIS
jgi:hypothetical protein